MPDPRTRFPLPLLLLLTALAAIVGGVVARMLPVGSAAPAAPRVLAGPPDDSVAAGVK